MTTNGCPLCGTGNHSCGQPFTGTPVDLPRREATTMSGGVKRYRVNVNGTDTVLKLNSEDAKKYKDAEPVDGGTVDSVMAESDEDSSDDSGDAPQSTGDADRKSVAAENKSRTASNKGGRSGGARNS